MSPPSNLRVRTETFFFTPHEVMTDNRIIASSTNRATRTQLYDSKTPSHRNAISRKSFAIRALSVWQYIPSFNASQGRVGGSQLCIVRITEDPNRMLGGKMEIGRFLHPI